MTGPLTPDVLIYDLTPASDPQISPDGARIAYTLGQTRRPQDGKPARATRQVWLCDRDGGNARQLTRNGDRNSGARWSPDGQWLAFVSNRPAATAKPGEPGQGHALCVLAVDGPGEAREITRHANQIRELAWSPDGRHLAYTTTYDPANPDETARPADAPPPVRVTRRIDYKQDNRGYLNDVRNQTFVVDVTSGARRRLTGDGPDPADHNFPQWSPDGRTIAAKRPSHNGMRSQLALIDVATGAETLVGPEEGVLSVWSWSPDGARILFAGDTQQTYQADFFTYDVASGAVRRLTDDLQIAPAAGQPTIVGPSQPVWLDERQALVHANRAGGSGLYVVDSETGATEPVVRWQAQSVTMSAGGAARWVAQDYSAHGVSGELAVTDTERGETTIITHYNDHVFAEHPAAQWERFDVRRGKYTIEAWLLKPPGFDPNRKYPLILDIHGGPNGFYGYGFSATQQCFATNGFLVVYANPRGSGSYGREFTTQVLRDWGGEDYLDLMAVVDETLKRPYADAERLGIYGYSYGGYMTAWTIGQTDRFKAAVCGAPCFDLESFFGTSDIGHVFGRTQFGAAPHEDREWYAQHSPSTYAYRVTTPTLIVQGEQDHRCPIGQGEQMFIALKEAGCEVEFARYPGGSHLMLRGGPPEHRADYLARTLAWFENHLQ